VPYPAYTFENFSVKELDMSKFTLLGSIAWIGSGVLFLFQAISTLIQPDNEYHWETLTLNDLLNAQQMEWINAISVDMIRNAADMIIHAQLILVLLGLGAIFFILGIFFSK